jgi:hypothetical protein
MFRLEAAPAAEALLSHLLLTRTVGSVGAARFKALLEGTARR